MKLDVRWSRTAAEAVTELLGYHEVAGALDRCIAASDHRDNAVLADTIRHTLCQYLHVKRFNWNPEKNEQLRAERGISFEEILSVFKTIIPSRKATKKYLGK